VRELYDPKREKFGKAVIPYDISSDSSNPKEAKKVDPNKNSELKKPENEKGDLSSKSKQPSRMLNKY
jgi:hypothetical protein